MRRRGIFLYEMLVAFALLTVVMTLAMRLTRGLFDTANEMNVAQRGEAAIDQATRLLRRDAETTTRLADDANGLTLDAATWSRDGDTLVRTAGGRATRFGPLPSPRLTAIDGRVRLRLGDAAWTFRPFLTPPGARP